MSQTQEDQRRNDDIYDNDTFRDHNYNETFSDVKSTLKFATINICGLENKLKFPDFDTFINQYDFVCITETKLDDFDSINIPGYTFFGINRKNARRKSGGVGLLVKNTLSQYIQTFDNLSSENCFWFTISKDICFKDIVFGVVYLPPEGSPYSSIDLFDNIENDIIQLNVNDDKCICLTGDLNARCGTLSDFVNFEDAISEINFDSETNSLLNRNNLLDLGFPLGRYSNDKLCYY